MKNRKFCIYTGDGQLHCVEAPSLRTALRNFETDEKAAPVIAAIEAGCLPNEPAEDRPFVAVFLKNSAFKTPEGIE